MKILSIALGLFLSTMLSVKTLAQGITTDNTMTPSDLVTNVLLGTGVTASNIMFNGTAANAVAVQPNALSFTATAFPFTSGVYLRTQGGASVATDPDLNAITTNTITNGAVLEFDFVALGDTVVFNYMFASAEYPTYVCSGFNDVFGFFISGPGFSGPYSNGAENIALVPGTNVPVAINTVNSGTAGTAGTPSTCAAQDTNWVNNSIYYTTSYANYSGEGYNGGTVSLQANASLQCGATYHIKLAISNVGDQALNSGVFLEAKSFSSNIVEVDIATANFDSLTGLGSVIVEGCDDAVIALIREDSDTAFTSYFDISGTAVNGVDYLPIADSAHFPIGVDTVYFTLSTIEDDMTSAGIEPPESIIFTTNVITPCNDTIYESDTVWILEEPLMYSVRDPDTTITCPTNDFLTLSATGAGGIPDYQVVWEGTDTGATHTIDITTNGVYLIPIEIEDSCHLKTVYDTIVVTVNYPPPFTVDIGNDTTVNCIGPFDVTAVPAGGAPNYLYSFNSGFPGPSNSATINLTTSGWVYVEAYDACFSETTDSIYVTIDPPMPTTFVSADTTIACPGDTAILTAGAFGGTPPYTYIWPTVISVTATAVVSPVTTTSYPVAISDGCLPNPIMDTVTVTVASYPPLTVTLPDQTPTCPGDDVFLSPVITGGNSSSYTYQWDGVPTSTADNLVDPTTNTIYTFEVTDACGVSTIETVEVTMPIYGPVLANFTGPDTVCVDQQHQLVGSATGGAGGYDFQWSGPATFLNQGQATTNFTGDSTGIYTLVVTDQCGTFATFDKFIVGEFCELFIPNILTPNGDGLNDILVIENIERFGNHLEISNRWGQLMFEADDYDNTWEPPSNISEGTYFYYILLEDGREYTGHITIVKTE